MALYLIVSGQMRKIRDYVYRIWQYKALSIKKLFQSKTIARQNRQNLGNV